MKKRYDSLTVVIPTLNEAKTIPILIKGITSSYPGAHILVVDDGSRDGTKAAVMQLIKRHKGLAIMDRKAMGRKGGLTASVIDGIVASKTRFVVVMDGDMQHPYQMIKNVIGALGSCGLVVCARSKIENWPAHRRIVSKLAVWSGLIVLSSRGKRGTKDIMSGFFGVRRELFMEVYKENKKRFISEGFKVLFDLLKSLDSSVEIKELPYTFRDRVSGASNAKPVHAFYLLKSFFT